LKCHLGSNCDFSNKKAGLPHLLAWKVITLAEVAGDLVQELPDQLGQEDQQLHLTSWHW
jgi:hypothetical protein